ncbi:DUF3363 domain-containing protein [Aquamicrobium sp.]|uniref:DUF3363 domain-containing protein n=1 Tax=Aquamicrobium sp. TaxID=1872579 RepID=UPI00258D27B7|nr:DUF3363 domain-containing protein [Aquamicrobium sp.]
MTWAATQWVAFRLGFQPQLGSPWFELAGWPVYCPPAIFIEGGIIAATGGKFDVVEKFHEFTLVPWRSAIDRRLGRKVMDAMHGGSVSWHLGRTRRHAL